MTAHSVVINKIAKLLVLAEGQGATPNEAANAAAAAQTLMERHKLSRAAIEVDSRVGVEAVGRADEPLWRGGRHVEWRRKLALGIGLVNDCRVLQLASRRGVPHSARLYLVGRLGDTQVVRYLFAYLCREIDRLAREAVQLRAVGNKRVWASSFRTGAAIEVVCRLREAKRQARADEHARMQTERGTATADRALVHLRDRSVAVDLWVKQHVGGPAPPSAASFDGSGLHAGRRAGATIPLHSGLSEGSAARQLPTKKTPTP